MIKLEKLRKNLYKSFEESQKPNLQSNRLDFKKKKTINPEKSHCKRILIFDGSAPIR